MGNSLQRTWFALLCGAGLTLIAAAGLEASPQDSQAVASSSLDRLKERLDTPVTQRLAPSSPVRLRPTFKSRVDQRVFVPTLEEDLHKTFDLTDFQRRYAEYNARCCGYDLGQIVRAIDKALDERRLRQIRAEIRRELAELEAANAKPPR